MNENNPDCYGGNRGILLYQKVNQANNIYTSVAIHSSSHVSAMCYIHRCFRKPFFSAEKHFGCQRRLPPSIIAIRARENSQEGNFTFFTVGECSRPRAVFVHTRTRKEGDI